MSEESNNPANKIENKDSLLVLDILVAEKQIIPQYREDIVLYTKISYFDAGIALVLSNQKFFF